MNKKLTFGKLESGDRFISFPTKGDNSGHGGYLGTHNVFIKIDPCYEDHTSFTKHRIESEVNAVNSEHGTLSKFTDSMEVIKVSK